jgi:hypothetical protein
VRRLVVIGLLGVAAAPCGDSATYSTEEVVDASQRHGYTGLDG